MLWPRMRICLPAGREAVPVEEEILASAVLRHCPAHDLGPVSWLSAERAAWQPTHGQAHLRRAWSLRDATARIGRRARNAPRRGPGALGGAAHQWASAGRAPSARCAGPVPPAPPQRTRGPGRHARLLRMDQTARIAAQRHHLQMLQQSLAEMAVRGGPGNDQAARVTGTVGGDLPRWQADRHQPGSPGSGVLPAALAREDDRSEHTFGGPGGPGCGTSLLYSLFDLFGFHF